MLALVVTAADVASHAQTVRTDVARAPRVALDEVKCVATVEPTIATIEANARLGVTAMHVANVPLVRVNDWMLRLTLPIQSA